MPRNPRSSRRSKAMRNLTSAGVGILNTTAKVAAKGTEKTFKWMATDHYGTAEFCDHQSKLMEYSQNANYQTARMDLSNRRMDRMNADVLRQIHTGVETSVFEQVFSWIVDHLIFLLDIVLGFFEPIIEFLLLSLFRIVLIIVLNVLFFGAIYLLLTA